MKTITHLILGILLVSFNLTQAQPSSQELNVSDAKKETSAFVEVRYYYYPNLQAYFDTKVALYLYKQNGVWVEAEQIPTTLRGYSLKNGQYVMIKDYNGDEPYTLLDEHKSQYPADYSSRPKRALASN